MEESKNGEEVGDSYGGLRTKIDSWICGTRCGGRCVCVEGGLGYLIDVKKMRWKKAGSGRSEEDERGRLTLTLRL